MAYNIPSSNTNALLPDTVDRLADLETVVAIKESSFDYRNFAKTAMRVADRLRIFGPIGLFGHSAIQLGACGSVGVMHHFWGRGPTELNDAFFNGDFDTALRLQRTSEALFDLLTANGRNMYASIKSCMQIVGNSGGFPRRPLLPCGPDDERLLRKGLEKLGLGRMPEVA